MSRRTRRSLTTSAELLCILIALSAGGMWSASSYATAGEFALSVVTLCALFLGGWLVIARRLGARVVSPSRNLAYALMRTMESWATTWGLAGLLAVSTVTPPTFAIWRLFLVGALLLAFLRLVTSFSPAGRSADRLRTIVIGSCPSARALTSTREASEAFKLCGFVPFAHEDPRQMPHLRKLGQVPSLAALIREHRIDAAIVSPSDDAITGEVHKVMDTCEALGLQTQYFPSFLDVDDMRVGMTWSANRPGLNVQMVGNPSVKAACKRAIDILGAGAGILALLPVFAACALAVKLTSKGPVLYRQTRVGTGGRTFNCFKFRTMFVGAHAQQAMLRAQNQNQQDGPAFKIKADPRITKVGRILRKFSLDELPQMFNVLLGDMSLVGPRPPIPEEVEEYTWWQRRRISVKPGLTCIWQVYGRNRVSFKRWVEMDLYYIDNWSLWMDVKLIAQTVKVVLRGTGM